MPLEYVDKGMPVQTVAKGQAVRLTREDNEHPGEQLFIVQHHCDPWKDWKVRNFVGGVKQVLEEKRPDEIIDAVIFPVGALGHGYPYETAFPCPGECLACDKRFTRWFIWRRPAMILDPRTSRGRG